MVVYIYYTYNSSRKFMQFSTGQLLSGQPVRYGKGRRYGPSITYKITPAGSLSSSQQGGPPCWASPLAFGLIVSDHNFVFIFAYTLLRFLEGKCVQTVHIYSDQGGKEQSTCKFRVCNFFCIFSNEPWLFRPDSRMIEPPNTYSSSHCTNGHAFHMIKRTSLCNCIVHTPSIEIFKWQR
jgi:hypothetical protein